MGKGLNNYKPFPCGHGKDLTEKLKRLDDYHPLTLDEITELLNAAVCFVNMDDIRFSVVRFSEIQCRLVQGIRGNTCPSRIDSPFREIRYEIDSNFQNVTMDNYVKMAIHFNRIMNG